jgi:hypothetical protein
MPRRPNWRPNRTLLSYPVSGDLNLAVANFEASLVSTELRTKHAKKEAVKRLEKDRSAIIEDLLKLLPVEDMPVCKRYAVTNASVEALGEILQENPNGVLVYADEMLPLLERMDQPGHADERGFYLSGWAGNSGYTFDRIVRGRDLHIEAVCLSMLGATQPGPFTRYLAHARRGGRGDDGLMQRFSGLWSGRISPLLGTTSIASPTVRREMLPIACSRDLMGSIGTALGPNAISGPPEMKRASPTCASHQQLMSGSSCGGVIMSAG